MTVAGSQIKPATYTVAETAKILRQGINQTYDAIHRGEIPSIQIGSRIHVPVVRLERLLAGGNAG